MYLSLLLMGFLIGLRHAIEADHIAAVASLSTRVSGLKDTIRHGAVWGLGHTITLFIFGSIALLADSIIPGKFATALELGVGIMLMILGLDVFLHLYRKRFHFHVHEHDDGVRHFHAHTHQGGVPNEQNPHRHSHLRDFPKRALFVGLMHGMAGSAALILLTLQSVHSTPVGLAYIALFGLGSIVGMTMLSAIIAVPLWYSAKRHTWLFNGLSIVVAFVTFGIGASLVFDYVQTLT